MKLFLAVLFCLFINQAHAVFKLGFQTEHQGVKTYLLHDITSSTQSKDRPNELVVRLANGEAYTMVFKDATEVDDFKKFVKSEERVVIRSKNPKVKNRLYPSDMHVTTYGEEIEGQYHYPEKARFEMRDLLTTLELRRKHGDKPSQDESGYFQRKLDDLKEVFSGTPRQVIRKVIIAGIDNNGLGAAALSKWLVKDEIVRFMREGNKDVDKNFLNDGSGSVSD